MSAALAEGLLALFDRLITKMRPDVDRAVDWLRDSAQPPQNLEFRASDGAQYTGVIIVERNRAVLMLAVRSHPAPSPTPAFQPAYSPPLASPSPAYQSRLRDFDDDPGDGWPPDPYGRR